MFCARCGANVPDGYKFCPSCGSTVIPPDGDEPETATDGNARDEEYEQDGFFADTDEEREEPRWEPINSEVFLRQPLPMNWFKFLVNFSLWAGAILNAALAVLHLTGTVYDLEGGKGMSAAVYAEYPSMRTLDVTFAIVTLALAAFTVYTRFRLARFRKNGPLLLLILYIALCAASVLNTFVFSSIIGDLSASDLSSCAFEILGTALMVAANKIYFDKRKHLFVN